MVSNAYAKSSVEYYAKAVFLFKVIDFVEWPNQIENDDKIINICIYGNDPFAGDLQEIANTGAKKKSFVIHYKKDINKLAECQILFLSRSEKYNVSNIISLVAKTPILTVSDIDKFAFKKGMIEIGINPKRRNFVLKMNIAAAKKSGIKLSSNLVELAAVTYGSIHEMPAQ